MTPPMKCTDPGVFPLVIGRPSTVAVITMAMPCVEGPTAPGMRVAFSESSNLNGAYMEVNLYIIFLKRQKFVLLFSHLL
jgi:hypothetical protein